MSFPRYPKYKDSGVEWLGEDTGWMTPDDQGADDEAAALGATRDGPDNDAEKKERMGFYT